MTWNDTGIITLPAGEALVKNRAVRISADTFVYADAGEDSVGITLDNYASGDNAAVRMHNHPGTHEVTVASSVVANALLYNADDGKFDDAVSGAPRYRAKGAGSGNNSIIEAIPLAAQNGTGMVPFSHTVTSGEASADIAAIDLSHISTSLSIGSILILSSGAPVVLDLATISSGVLTINNSGVTGLTAGDVISGFVVVGPNTD